MPRNSASPLASSIATVFEFLPALARRHLATRIGGRASIHVTAGADGVLTIARQFRGGGTDEMAEDRIAQLRVAAGGRGYQLFWKKGNGRWTAYSRACGDVFVGSIDDCFAEIARDPFGRYWS